MKNDIETNLLKEILQTVRRIEEKIESPFPPYDPSKSKDNESKNREQKYYG